MSTLDDFKFTLLSLSTGSQNKIMKLTLSATENIDQADIIVKMIVDHLNAVVPAKKLFVLYLIDSILKHCDESYVSLFSKHIVKFFTSTFKKVSKKDRQMLYKIRCTWKTIISSEILLQLDRAIYSIDKAWPTSSTPVQSDIMPSEMFSTTSKRMKVDFDMSSGSQEERSVNESHFSRVQSSFFEMAKDYEDSIDNINTIPYLEWESEMCAVCGKQFELCWVREAEDWHLKDAIKYKDKVYHPCCCEDLKKKEKVTEKQKADDSPDKEIELEYLNKKLMSAQEQHELILNSLQERLKELDKHILEVRSQMEEQTENLRERSQKKLEIAEAKRESMLKEIQEKIKEFANESIIDDLTPNVTSDVKELNLDDKIKVTNVDVNKKSENMELDLEPMDVELEPMDIELEPMDVESEPIIGDDTEVKNNIHLDIQSEKVDSYVKIKTEEVEIENKLHVQNVEEEEAQLIQESQIKEIQLEAMTTTVKKECTKSHEILTEKHDLIEERNSIDCAKESIEISEPAIDETNDSSETSIVPNVSENESVDNDFQQIAAPRNLSSRIENIYKFCNIM